MQKRKWKKNYRKLPRWILDKVEQIETDGLLVTTVKKITSLEISEGHYSHLNIDIQGEKLILPPVVLPTSKIGKYSKINVMGLEKVRKDLPKITKYFSTTIPVYGDTSNMRDVDIPRLVYQRDFFPPKELELKMELVREEGNGKNKIFYIKFSIDELLIRHDIDFENRLFNNINLLQENIGQVDIFSTDAKQSDYLKTLYIDWEILPVGESTLERIITGFGKMDIETKEEITERYNVLKSLNPTNIIRGTSGFKRYFGAKFSDELVVFENIEFGNAIYVMFENWDELSKLSRTELLQDKKGQFERIQHRGNWIGNLTRIVNAKR